MKRSGFPAYRNRLKGSVPRILAQRFFTSTILMMISFL